MKKILIIFGTRPEAIKLAPIIHELNKFPGEVVSRVCVTAQHRFMLDQVLELFEIVPDYDLNLMQPNQTLFELSSQALNGIAECIDKEKPNVVLVQGDTTTAFISSLAAFYQKVVVGHVEAGLRTGSKYSPFPEEVNRKLITALTDVHFAPTESTRRNLVSENIPDDRIFVTGNTVIDALYMTVKKDIPLLGRSLEKINLTKRLILVTAHRRETFGKYIAEICNALAELAKNRDDIEIVYPVHLNPNVRNRVQEIIGTVRNIHLLEPLDYGRFVSLMNKCHLILTDSGGIQEEAPSLGKPVLVLREVTERREVLETGNVKLIGRRMSNIVRETNALLDDHERYTRMSISKSPYGDGNAAQRIVEVLLGADLR